MFIRAIALLSAVFYTTSAVALTLEPTLDTLKTESGNLSGNYILTELGENTLPEGAEKVTIDGVVYYFTPSGDDANLLSILSGTSAGSLIEDNNGIFDYNGTKYSFNVSAIPNSAFSYGEGSETDYNFTTQTADSDGNLTTKYYKIYVDETKIGTSNNITYDVKDNKPTNETYVTITLPNNKEQYIVYKYVQSADRPFYTSSIYGDLSGNIDADFIGIPTHGFGVVYRSEDDIGDITGDFIGNYNISSYNADGAAINATVGNIIGDFIGNYVISTGTSSSSNASGGAIHLLYDTVGNITGDFIGNYVKSSGSSGMRYHDSGGAITNFDIVGDITGNFIGNYVIANNDTQGGAIYSYGGVNGNITGDFIGNYIESTGSESCGGAINADMGIFGNITGDFIGNYAIGNTDSYGGAIYTRYDAEIGNITGSFIGNYTKADTDGAYGGAIYHYGTGSIPKIGVITGDFIGNYTNGYYASGGAIYNNKGIISDIVGNFKDNYADGKSASGGAIYMNSSSYMDNITGDFIGNYAKANGYSAYGGAIYSFRGVIGDITGDFIGNYVKAGLNGAHAGAIQHQEGKIGNIIGNFIENYAISTGASSGGAIRNTATNANSTGRIGNIIGDFIGNYASSSSSSSSSSYSAQGGAIYNYVSNSSSKSIIGNISGNFIDNYVSSKGAAKGGAIYNYAYSGTVTIGDIINSSFTDNHAIGSSAQGGAIYTNANVSIVADNGVSSFSGNYVQSSSTGTKNYEAIYVDSDSATLSLTAKNNGVIEFDDYINGVSGYDVVITGDASGKVNLYNDIKNADVSTDSVTINTVNNEIHNYVFNTLTSNANTNYIIDVDVTNQTADMFTTTLDSTGIVTLGELNMIEGYFSDLPQDMTGKEFKIQILKTQNDSLQLALSDDVKEQLGDTEYKIVRGYNDTYDEIKLINTWEDIYNKYTGINDYYGTLGLATTDTTNDSIGLNITKYVNIGSEISSMGDTLKLVNQYETSDAKEFNATSNTSSYTVTEDLGETASGTLSINGIKGGASKSVIDFDNHSGFELTATTTLNINDVEIKNAFSQYGGAIIRNTDSASAININNVSFTDNHAIGSSAKGGAIYTNANVSIVADNGVSSFSGNYVQSSSTGTKNYEAIYVDSASATLSLTAKNNGVIEFDDYINGVSGYDVVITGDASGKVNLYNDIKNADVSTDSVTINTVNNEIHNYVFNTLTSNANTNYIIDVDVTNQTADMFTTTLDSTGIVTLGELNITNGSFSDLPQDMTGKEFKIQILKTQNDGLQLALSDDVKNQLGDTEYKIGSGYGNITYDEIKAVTTWEDKYNKYAEFANYYGTLGLATTDTTNDSIGLSINRYEILGTEKIGMGDTLRLINQYETSDAREFNATSNTSSYTVTEDLGETASGTLSINGIKGGASKSVIDFDNHSGFELTATTTLNINDVEIKNAFSQYNGSAINIGEDAIVRINNVDFTSNHSNADSAWLNGGAIYNEGSISEIRGTFDSNYISSLDNGGEGGAIFNDGIIGNITGDFTGNHADGESTYGGAIENYDTIGNITGNFIGNYASVGGGAIENYGNSIGNISGDFISNYIENDYGEVYGGAISNYANLGYITGDFISNNVTGEEAKGGAISNDRGTIEDIIGDFSGNYAEGNYAYGGALYNYMGVIDDINGSFNGNYVHGNNYAYGGAIYNYGISNIDDITGSFIGNSAVASNAYGGAVFNDYNGLIGVITGDFINNYVQGGDTYGGAIYNRSYMGDINGNFENNYAEGDYAYGGALYNEYGNIDDITGNFSYNSAYGYDGGYGGAIYNNSNIDDITGDFTGNYAEGENASGGAVYNNGEIPLIAGGFYDNATYGDYANGGAIYNSNYLGDLKGDFSNNYAQSESESIGGAIFNAGGNINDIIGNFSGNYSLSNNGFAGGGALFNNMGVIDDIEGDFTGNYAQGYDAEGGAIFNYGINIDDVTGNFSNNYAKGNAYAYGGAIYSNSLLGDLNGDFSKNYASALDAFGGAIYNTNYLGDINGNFEGNYAIGEYALGGAIYNVNYGNIDDITGNFIRNYVKGNGDYAAGGAILNDRVIDDITGDFIGNYAQGYGANGGAISNSGEIGTINGSFINNYVKVTGEDEIGYGGAIATNTDLTFITEGTNNRFSGNYVENADGSKVSNAIFVYNDYENGAVSLNFEVGNNGSYTIDDQIDGGYVNYTNDGPTIVRDGYGYNINIYGEVCPQCVVNSVIFNSEVKNVYDLTLDTTQMVLGKDAHIQIVNDYIATGETNPYLRLDVDAVNSKTGQLEIGGQVIGTTQVIANIVNYKDVRGEESIVFATAENDTTGGEESFKIFRTIGSPYKWYVDYDESAKTWGLAMGEDANDYEEDCTEPEDPEEPKEPEIPEVFDGFMPTLDRIKEGIQIVDYISDVEALPNSAFTYEVASSGDNSFIFTDTNAYGVESDKAYKIVLRPEEFSTSPYLTFTADISGSIEVQLPNGETQYYSYEYTGDEIGATIGYSQEGSGWLNGGAVYNDGNMGDLTADFVENYISSLDDGGEGGAIFNDGTIGNISGDFVGNYAEGKWTYGGAIENYDTIGNITGSFIGNYAHTGGGAIENYGSSIGNITGDFIGNYVESIEDNAYGGAISSYGDIGNITGDFISNHAKGDYAYGGAISNNIDYGHTIGNITGDFIGNYVEGTYYAVGGAIYTNGNVEYTYDDGDTESYEIGTITGSFIDNYVKVTDGSGFALGGAIFVDGGEFSFKADGTISRFSGNYVENADGSKVNNAIWINNYDGDGSSVLNFEVKNGGAVIFDDEIDGGYYDWGDEAPIKDGYGYNVNIYGDVCPQCIVNSVIFNSKVKNVYNLTLDTTQMVLGKDAHIEIVNDYIAQNNPYLRLNVDAVNGKTGQLEIGGQVVGTTQVIANIVNYKDVRGEESIVFATAKNDTTGGEDSFKIFRTVGSPYKWYVDYDESAKTWGLAMGDEANDYEEDCYPKPEPNPDQPSGPIEVAPEVIGFEALPSAGLSQTNGMVYNIQRKVGVNRLYCPGCGFYDYNWNGEPFHNVWVDTTYNGLTIEAPVEIDAKVWGIEAGADIQKDLNNKLGIFVSYRQGNYEMDGKGEKYFSKVGSKLDIDSYLAGLYYRYDNNNWYAFATLYGGMQNAEIQTDDGVSVDTDGIEFGGSAEIGYSHALNKTVYITPSLGVFYSQISYDDASDDYGKTVEYGDLKQVELEAGLKLSKAVYTDNGTASVYVKPSVVQTLVDGDEINITEIGKVDTVEDKTLGRIELGGNIGFNENWSGYGWANYTFGSDYEATSLGLGLNYAW